MRLCSVYYISVDSSTCLGCFDTHPQELVQLQLQLLALVNRVYYHPLLLSSNSTHGSVHRESNLIIVQQDGTVFRLPYFSIDNARVIYTKKGLNS